MQLYLQPRHKEKILAAPSGNSSQTLVLECSKNRRTDYFSEYSGRRDVTVANGRHGDDGPPSRRRNAAEPGVLLVLLHEVGKGREHQHTHGQEEQQETQLLVAVFQGVGYCLESSQHLDRLFIIVPYPVGLSQMQAATFAYLLCWLELNNF